MDGWDSEEETGASATGTAANPTNNEGPNNSASQSNTWSIKLFLFIQFSQIFLYIKIHL